MEVPTSMDLPGYSPSAPVPDYSSKPLPGEKCIQKTPRHPSYDHGDCSFTYQEHSMSLTLRGCREEDGVPAFGLCSTVHGEFEPINRDKIVSVVVKLEGRILLKGRSQTMAHVLFSKEHLLWKRSGSAESACPSLLPLTISFPATYRDAQNDRSLRLPPSVIIGRPRRAAVAYSLNIIVQKTKSALFSRKTREVRMSAHLCYRPRVRPPRPAPICFSGLKFCPDEWQEEIWAMSKGTSGGDRQALTAQCHFFLPSVRVFATGEAIPFHLSFFSSISFLRNVMSHISPQTDDVIAIEHPIHVFLLRQTTVHTKGSKTIHEEVIGTGAISPNPTTVVDAVYPDNPLTMSWDGELRCETPVEHTGFTTAALEVKDYMVLSLIVPPGPLKSIPPNLHHTIPIRLVTHPWIDRS
ncbi:hypothetical protein HYDPIDRAFT_30161 [Hydnomerulius pinastri MD-312]|uniref:Arrestin-like N-terminal domain-containing protein n=1 Tax=Hydnomerulius pinastri MD-312 TaxID=994086 RepID=A0A0C9W6K3_9AGAM|nr:hypothetical protein HYDPIDRAFT_30161 [Hydnomerulius pinastri MD-312]